MQTQALKLFSQELGRKRILFGLTQEQAAEMLDISYKWYQKIESGKHSPNFNLSCRIAKVFSIDYADFCTEEICYDYIKTANRYI